MVQDENIKQIFGNVKEGKLSVFHDKENIRVYV